jgi:hypothetical protein
MRTGRGYSGNMFVGSKYDETSNLGITEIAKLVRKELKDVYPKTKFSVKVDKYSGGCSLDVKIVDIDFNPYSDKFNAFLESNASFSAWNESSSAKFNDKYEAMRDYIKAILNQYNYDDSDPQTDYFSVKFYSHVNMEETTTILKYHPNHKATKENADYWKDVNEKTKARNKAAAEKKKELTKGFKKGQEVVYIYDKNSKFIPNGVYDAIITKVPNGRATFSTFEIKFAVTERYDSKGNLIKLKEASWYRQTLYNADNLKNSRADIRKEKILGVIESDSVC